MSSISTVRGGPRGIVVEGLVLNLNAADSRSYPGFGTTWSDLTTNRNNGTLLNGPTFSSANGGNIVFDGLDDYVRLALGNTGPLSIIGTGDFTICVIASNTGTVAFRWFLSNWSGTGMHMGMNNVNSYFGGYFGDNDEMWTDYSIPNDNSYHLYVASRNSGTIKYYVDGFERSVIRGTTTNKNNTMNSSAETRIGCRGDSISQLWKGSISLELIYNRALSAQEVLQNYNATKTRFGL